MPTRTSDSNPDVIQLTEGYRFELESSYDNLVAWGGKADVVHQINKHFEIPLENTAFVGDGRNDMSVFKVVGLSIAFNPEDQDVADAANVVVRDNDLRAIMPHVIPEFPQ